jgi:hypothetical protein
MPKLLTEVRLGIRGALICLPAPAKIAGVGNFRQAQLVRVKTMGQTRGVATATLVNTVVQSHGICFHISGTLTSEHHEAQAHSNE